VLDEAASVLPDSALLQQALQLLRLDRRPSGELALPAVDFDLADLRGYAYYSGMRFGIYTTAPATRWCAAAATTRSGRVRPQPPGRRLQLDLVRELVGVAAQRRCRPPSARRGGRRPDASTARASRTARQGETVVCVLPGHDSEDRRIPLRPRTARDARAAVARASPNRSSARVEAS
jgi:ATP phosphoribosyltransferase regulatory subunit